MTFRRLEYDKADFLEKLFGLNSHLLPMLQRTRAVICDALSGRSELRLKADFAHELRNVAGQRRYHLSFFRELRIITEHEAIVLYSRSTS